MPDPASSGSGEAIMPTVVLQGVRPLLSLADVRRARQVCREWASELASDVHAVQLPPKLWQLRGRSDGTGASGSSSTSSSSSSSSSVVAAERGQADGLARLVATYWSFTHAHLLADGAADVDAAAVSRAVATLARVSALQGVTVARLSGASAGWAAVLGGLAGLGARVQALELRDVRLPGPEGLLGLAALTRVTELRLHSASGSGKLQQAHVEAVARMAQLRGLSLSFRAVGGTLAEPLTLDCLGGLPKLRRLEVCYTGMAELSTGVCFASQERLLEGAASLERLVLSRVPTPSLRGLFRLPALRSLTLLQLAPLAEAQARSLALCTQLTSLAVDNMPLELLPHLGALTGLRELSVSVWAPPAAAGSDLPGGPHLRALAALTGLRSAALEGPVLAGRADVEALAGAWRQLTALRLAVTLMDGAAGLESFHAVETLALRPWNGVSVISSSSGVAGVAGVAGAAAAAAAAGARLAGQAGLGGAEEGPLHDGRKRVAVRARDLPPRLRELHGVELEFVRGEGEDDEDDDGEDEGAAGDGIVSRSASASSSAAEGAAGGFCQAGYLEGFGSGFAPDDGEDGGGDGQQQQQRRRRQPRGPRLRALSLRYAPDVAPGERLALPPARLLRGLTSLELQHPAVSGGALAAALAACAPALERLVVNAADSASQFGRAAHAVPHTPSRRLPAPRRPSGCGGGAGGGGSGGGGGGRISAFANFSTAMGTSLAAAGAAAAAAAAAAGGVPVSGVATVAAAAAATGVALTRVNSLSQPPPSGGGSCSGAAGAGPSSSSASAAAAAAAAAPGRSSMASSSSSFAFGAAKAAATAAAAGGVSAGASTSAAAAAAASGSGSTNGSSSGSTSTSGAAGGLLRSMPSLSRTLSSMGSGSFSAFLSEALGGLGGGGGGGGGAGGLSTMGASLNEGGGNGSGSVGGAGGGVNGGGAGAFGPLARCTALRELSLVAGERALGPRARAAIAALPALRRLSLVVASDAPGGAARELGAWLPSLRGRAEWVAVGLEGPGAGPALADLGDRAVAALGACDVHVLRAQVL